MEGSNVNGEVSGEPDADEDDSIEVHMPDFFMLNSLLKVAVPVTELEISSLEVLLKH